MNTRPSVSRALDALSNGYHDPSGLVDRNRCPRCQRETHCHAFIIRDGSRIETHHCPTHGDVSPMRSHIVRPEKAA